MSWIKIIDYKEASGKLKKIYDRVKGPENNVDNILLAHSLRPHTLEGHMMLYKNVLHNKANTIPKHFLETIGVYVSLMNTCTYCVEHHYQGLKRLLQADSKATAIFHSLKEGKPENCFEEKELAALRYVELLSKTPAALEESTIQKLRTVGWTDGEILEINQVTSYFAYANRTVLGLGVTTKGDIIGLSPGDNDDPDNWSHA